MNREEQLFIAIGEADTHLLARSERRQRHPWIRYCFAGAACLTLLLTAGYWGTRSSVPDTEEPGPSSGMISDSTEPLLPTHNSSGTLRLLSYAPLSQEDAVDFLIYVNEELFNICEENGLYSIRSNSPLPDDFPVCELNIFHMAKTAPAEAAALAEKTFPADACDENAANCLPGSLYYRSSGGTDWDSKQAELWFADDGQEGTFVLISRYFLEAEEGLGQRFQDMVSSFRIVSPDGSVPSWLQELYETVNQLLPALFTGDISSVSGLLTEDVRAEAYGEDVWDTISVASVDYTLGGDQEPSSAVVSVKHRLYRIEGDSFSYLTMYLVHQNGRWLLEWSGIEK